MRPAGDIKVWCRFLTRGRGAPSERDTVAAISGAGLTVCAHDANARSNNNNGGGCNGSSGILFFDGACEEVYDFLRESSRGGLERVLAIACGGKGALANGDAWELLCAGASDVLAWSHPSETAAAAAARFARWAEVDRIVESPLVKENLVGESPAWKSVLRRAVEVARFTDSSVLILGESGTGKELLARLIHTLDARPNKGELIILDCTTVVAELSGSEFFGHERGSYTSATYAREGAFALADRGTLFLDEVGELTPRLQSELLRVVQDGTYKRVGSNAWKQTSFRLVCATNRNLLCEEESQFRRDFFHRIAGWTCVLPSLAERTADIPHLVRHFLRRLCTNGDEPPELDEPVREYLLGREYRGNVRELKAVVERMARRHVGGGAITVGDVDEMMRPSSHAGNSASREWRDDGFESAIRRAVALGVGLKEIGNAATETAIRVAVGDEDGNLQRAARRLGVTDRALQMRRASQREEQKQPAATSPINSNGNHQK
ncbi:MAG TPA: sigma 54-interacting transcriptional regulator [Pyrinomonadaceae bacterium]|nr:sigma 54-interacting transcriptional regulator [Pyrinomonadaceae bacterium]